jgi:hypothetical protein
LTELFFQDFLHNTKPILRSDLNASCCIQLAAFPVLKLK